MGVVFSLFFLRLDKQVGPSTPVGSRVSPGSFIFVGESVDIATGDLAQPSVREIVDIFFFPHVFASTDSGTGD